MARLIQGRMCFSLIGALLRSSLAVLLRSISQESCWCQRCGCTATQMPVFCKGLRKAEAEQERPLSTSWADSGASPCRPPPRLSPHFTFCSCAPPHSSHDGAAHKTHPSQSCEHPQHLLCATTSCTYQDRLRFSLTVAPEVKLLLSMRALEYLEPAV